MKLRLRYFLNPVRSAKSLWWLISTGFYTRYADFRVNRLPRGRVDHCWCSGEIRPLEGQPSYGVCQDCGCCVNRRPILGEALGRLYAYDFYWVMRQKAKGFPTIEARAELYRQDGRLDYWLTLVERFSPQRGKVVEIGGAPGVLLRELQTCGYTCLGVEGDEKVAAWMRQRMQIDVRSGLFPGIDLPACDLLLAFDVLEHTPDPLGFMTAIAKLLKPGGVAIVQVPIELEDTPQPFASRPDFFDDVEHLYLFTARSIKELSKRCGLDIVALEKAAFSLGGLVVLTSSLCATTALAHPPST